MSISSQVSRVSYTGAGSTNTYSYTFKIFDEDDLLVIVSLISTGVETTLTKTTDYTVTGVGETSGGTIVLVNSGQAWLSGGNLANTYKIFIRRQPDIIQETDIRNQGPYFPESIENQFDKLVFIDQAQQDELNRSVKLPTSIISSDFDPTLPVDIDTANVAIVTNATGDGLAKGPTTSEISNAQGYAEDASDSADLAEDWASKTNGIVDATDYSSKAWAVGGTGVTTTASRGSAKDWATKTDAQVDTSDYSAKEWAKGTQTRGAASGGSAKDWANYTGGTVDNTEYSAKYYANAAATSAAEAATSAAASQWSDVQYITSVDSPVTVVDSDAGKLFSVDTTGGAVIFNLPAISGLTLAGPWSIGIKKTNSSANNITVNPNGSETIGGAASKVISRQGAGSSFIPDADGTPDNWEVLSFGEVPIAGDIVGTTDTQDLSNKTFINNTLFSNQAAVRFGEQTGNGSNYIGLTAPDAVTNNTTFKLPDGDGTTDQVLKTNGSAQLGWASVAVSTSVSTQTSASFSAAINNLYLIDTTSNDVTANLPTAVGIAGQRIVFKVINNTNDFIIDADSSDLIDGVAAVYLNGLYDSATLVSDGTNWVVNSFESDHEYSSSSGGLGNYSITAGDYGDLTSLTLTRGSYLVKASANFFSNGAVTTTSIGVGISETSGNSSTGLVRGENLMSLTKTQTSSRHDSIFITPYRINVTGTSTTIYLKSQANTSITNLQVAYSLKAQKIGL
jgi:hypothetical protein